METKGLGKNDFEQLCVNALRVLSVHQICNVGSGHPGLPMGAAAMAYVLWNDFLRHNPKNPDWVNRDRFVLSAGHGSTLLYSLLHLTGYNLPLSELIRFRQFESNTPGHPEYGKTPGVEVTTGPLGQGFSTSVGIALAQKILAFRYNRENFNLFDYNVYTLASDGDLMEGISYEAMAIAGRLRLGNLICLFDSNKITIDGKTKLISNEKIKKRFRSCHWHVVKVKDGNSLNEIREAIIAAKADRRPSLIIVKTIIGYGNPNRQGTPQAHSGHFRPQELKLVHQTLNWPEEKLFQMPNHVVKHYRVAIEIGQNREKEWNDLFAEYKLNYPTEAFEIEKLISGKFNLELDDIFSQLSFSNVKVATRVASGEVMNAIAKKHPGFIGGSADLASSCKTYLTGLGDVTKKEVGQNIHFGVHEHSMGAILSGLALTNFFKPFGSTFLAFGSYMIGAIRNCALMNLPVIYVFTHDSIGVGKDGPTHQPIEQVMSLRLIPNLTVIRPADANEVVQAWKFVMQTAQGPVAIILTRQDLPLIDRSKYADAQGVLRGAYVLNPQIENPQAIIIATGSEVYWSLKASEMLLKEDIKVRVVSMPSWEIFDAQDEQYKNSVLPRGVKARVSVEAGSTLGWQKYVGCDGVCLGVDTFGFSAPSELLFSYFGLTEDNVAAIVRKLIEVC